MGTYLQGEEIAIHDWTRVNFDKFIYSSFRFNGTAAGPTIVINGNTFTKIVGVQIECIVHEEDTVLDEDILLIGNLKPDYDANIKGIPSDEYLNKYSFNFTLNNSEWFNCDNNPSLRITGDLTVSVWASPTVASPPSPPADGYMLENYNAGAGYAIFQDRPAGLWTFRIGTGALQNCIGVTPITPLEWVLVTGVWDSVAEEMRLYLNGNLENTTSLPGQTLLDSGADFRIGAGNVGSNEFYGNLSNGAVWAAALTEEEIRNNVFGNGTPSNLMVTGPQRDSLVSWWKLGDDASWDGSKWSIIDQMGNNNSIDSNNLVYASRQINAPH